MDENPYKSPPDFESRLEALRKRRPDGRWRLIYCALVSGMGGIIGLLALSRRLESVSPLTAVIVVLGLAGISYWMYMSLSGDYPRSFRD